MTKERSIAGMVNMTSVTFSCEYFLTSIMSDCRPLSHYKHSPAFKNKKAERSGANNRTMCAFAVPTVVWHVKMNHPGAFIAVSDRLTVCPTLRYLRHVIRFSTFFWLSLRPYINIVLASCTWTCLDTQGYVSLSVIGGPNICWDGWFWVIAVSPT